MKTSNLIDIIGNIDDNMIEEARKKPAGPKWPVWAAAAACLCLAAGGIFYFAKAPKTGGNHVQAWSASYSAEDYFRYSGTGDGSTEAKSVADSAKEYAESRFYSDDRSLMEENEVIPALQTHPLFYAEANFEEDGSLYSVVLSWHRRDLKGLEHYSDLSVIAGHKEVPIVRDCIFVETDENGNVLEPAVTVTERDGVLITARGRENQEKTITFQNESGWYQISGSYNDRYEDVVSLFTWFWEHPIDFSRFTLLNGDCYTYTTLDAMPEAFSGSRPDFAARGFVCGYSTVTLKNEQPVAFEAVYVSNVTREQAESSEYTPGENGVDQIHWCLKAEPDVYELAGCIGDVESVTKEQLLSLSPPDSVTTQTRVQLRQGDWVLIIYTTDVDAVWELIESIR